MEIMMIHFKLKTSIYDTIDIYDKYGTYTSFIIPNKYSSFVIADNELFNMLIPSQP